MFKSVTALFFDGKLLRFVENTFGIADGACSRPSSIFGMYALPSLFKCLLDLFQTVKSGHLLARLGLNFLLLNWCLFLLFLLLEFIFLVIIISGTRITTLVIWTHRCHILEFIFVLV